MPGSLRLTAEAVFILASCPVNSPFLRHNESYDKSLTPHHPRLRKSSPDFAALRLTARFPR